MRLSALVPALLAVACTGGGEPDGDTDLPVDPFEAFIHPTEEVGGGGTACFTPGPDHASTAWLTQSADPASVGAADVVGQVSDFQIETLTVEATTVALWLDDAVEGAPDVVANGDEDGGVLLEGAATCAPLTYRVTTDPLFVETQTTYKAHHVYPPAGKGQVVGDFLSVSADTYQLIPTLLNVAVDPSLAVIAGTAYGCDRDAGLPSDDDAEKLTGVQVIVYDEAGNIPESLSVHYFTERFPDREQPHTSPDGLWVALNVPPGRLRAEAWGLVGGELTLLGATVLDSEADSINIANVFAGYGDGVKLPTACLAP